MSETKVRARAYFDTIRNLLYPLERARNPTNITRPSLKTGCTAVSGAHLLAVRLLPAERPDHIVVVVPKNGISRRILDERVIEPLRSAGFPMEEPQNHHCGCITFTVKPRRRPVR